MSHSKLKSVLSILKRKVPSQSGGSVKFMKPVTGAISPTKRPRSRGQLRRATTPISDDAILESLRLGLVEPVDIEDNEKRFPPTNVRSKFKKQMIDKELATVGEYF
jgi:hypothetical protein